MSDTDPVMTDLDRHKRAALALLECLNEMGRRRDGLFPRSVRMCSEDYALLCLRHPCFGDEPAVVALLAVGLIDEREAEDEE